jgi:hypothetical protein
MAKSRRYHAGAGKRYGKTHCPRTGVMVDVDPQNPKNLSSRALVMGPGSRPGTVKVQFRFNAGPGVYDVSCDRLRKALTRPGVKAEPRTYLAGRRRRKRRR